MKVIVHYRDLGFYQEPKDENLFRENILDFLKEGQFNTIVDIREYEFDFDNQDDFADLHPSEEKYMNCFLIMEVENVSDVTKLSSVEINKEFFKNWDKSELNVTQSWVSGNEQFYVVEMNENLN